MARDWGLEMYLAKLDILDTQMSKPLMPSTKKHLVPRLCTTFLKRGTDQRRQDEADEMNIIFRWMHSSATVYWRLPWLAGQSIKFGRMVSKNLEHAIFQS